MRRKFPRQIRSRGLSSVLLNARSRRTLGSLVGGIGVEAELDFQSLRRRCTNRPGAARRFRIWELGTTETPRSTAVVVQRLLWGTGSHETRRRGGPVPGL